MSLVDLSWAAGCPSAASSSASWDGLVTRMVARGSKNCTAKEDLLEFFDAALEHLNDSHSQIQLPLEEFV